jgi:hypothetical protein
VSTLTAPTLALRVTPENPDHHIWFNNGTWWCHFTLHLLDYTSQRRRVSLRTRDRGEARRRRDALLAAVAAGGRAPDFSARGARRSQIARAYAF